MNKLWQAGNSCQLKTPSPVYDLTCEHHNTVSKPSTNKSKHEHYINQRHSQRRYPPEQQITVTGDSYTVIPRDTHHTLELNCTRFLPTELSTSVSRSYLITQTPWRKRSPVSESHLVTNLLLTHFCHKNFDSKELFIQFRHFLPADAPDHAYPNFHRTDMSVNPKFVIKCPVNIILKETNRRLKLVRCTSHETTTNIRTNTLPNSFTGSRGKD